MFKLLIALSLFLAIQGQITGGFEDRPELIKSPDTRLMVNLAITELEKTENLQVSPVAIVSVSSQLVNGMNYRIIFTAQEKTTHDAYVCTAKVYQTIDGQRSVSSIQCV